MPNKSKQDGFYINVTCPGCGAGLRLDNDFFVLTCQYCDSVLRIKMPDLPPAYLVKSRVPIREARFAIDRYLKENNLPLTDFKSLQIKRIYYPYWKVDSIMLRVRNKVVQRLVASETENSPEVYSKSEKTEIGYAPYYVTVPAGTKLQGIPDSIGIRSQTVETIPYTTENIEDEYNALEVKRPWDQIWNEVVGTVVSVGDFDSPSFGKNRTEMLYPDFSVIYFPYLLADSFVDLEYRRFVIDAVSARVVNCHNPVDVDIPDESKSSTSTTENRIAPPILTRETGKSNQISVGVMADRNLQQALKVEFDALQVEFHRCSTCGMDLPDNRSCLYICSNCHELKAIEQLPFELASIQKCTGSTKPDSTWLPFWSYGFSENSLMQIRQLLGGMFVSKNILVPAFQTSNFEAATRLSRKMSFAISKLDSIPVEQPDQSFYPAELSAKLGARLLNLLAYREWVKKFSKSKSFSGPNDNSSMAELEPLSAGLIYVPFKLQNYFFVDSILDSITFEKRLLED